MHGIKANKQLHRAYIQNGYKRVQGWLSSGAVSLITAIDRIQKEMEIRGHIGEIGIHHGKLFILMYLLRREGENTVAVDTFDMAKFNIDESGRGNKRIFLKNVDRYAKTASQLKIIQQDSQKLKAEDIRNTVGGSVRLFSIDGGHTAGITCHDLETISGSLSEGGVIILDDYFNEEWPEVSEGTNRFYHKKGYKRIFPFLIGGNKTFFTSSKEYAEKYIEALQSYRIGTAFKLSQLFGSTVIYYGFDRLKLQQRLEKTWLWKKLRNKVIGQIIRRLTGHK
jgi:hypothetical protein